MVAVYRYVALSIVGILTLVLWMSQVLPVAIVISSVVNYLLFEYSLRWLNVDLKELCFNDVALIVVRQSNDCFSGEITDNSLVCDWFCLLMIKKHGQSGRLWRIIWRDMIDDNAYRRLSRVVRIKRRLI